MSFSKRFLLIFLILGLFILFLIFNKQDEISNNKPNENFVNYDNSSIKPKEQGNFVFYFYDNNTNCSINGNFYLNGIFIDKIIDGKINTTTNLFFYPNNSGEISVQGITDECFKNNRNLPFYQTWEFKDWDILEGDNYEQDLDLDLSNLHKPTYPEEMQGFIRPSEIPTSIFPSNIDNSSKMKELEGLFKFIYTTYISDNTLFNQNEYWQTPKEYLNNKKLGDCEDWAVYTVSFFKAYDPSLDCYLLVWSTHSNVLCAINNTFIIFDQEQIKKRFSLDSKLSMQDNRILIREWLNNYFKEYGTTVNERTLFYVINQSKYFSFNEKSWKKEFEDWILEKAGI